MKRIIICLGLLACIISLSGCWTEGNNEDTNQCYDICQEAGFKLEDERGPYVQGKLMNCICTTTVYRGEGNDCGRTYC